MKISPIDVTNKSFSSKMFGIDENEVMDFLTLVAAQMEETLRERNTLREILREKELSIAESKEKESLLKSTITTASQMADRFRSDAEREAHLIITDAQQKAEMITRDSRESLRKLYQEIAELRKARMQFEANLKAIAQAHLTLLDQGEKFMPSVNMPQSTELADMGYNAAPAVNNTASNNRKKSAEISPLMTNPTL